MINSIMDQGKSLDATIIRGTICHVTDNPFAAETDLHVLEAYEDGGLAFDCAGKIIALGPFGSIARSHPRANVIDRSGSLVLPGFIDCHIHFPQTLMIGAYGEELLDWLKRHTFPEEIKYKDPEYARQAASIFFQEEIANGTTTALIYGAHFEDATAIAFAEARKVRFRAVMGLTLSDRNLPDELALAPEEAYLASKRLIEAWHGVDKLKYAVTPRFAPTCSPELLRQCRRLLDEHADIYFQTHLNENRHEISWVKDLFANSRSYLDVYHQFKLLGDKSFFDHSIHSNESEISLLAQTGSRVVHCPSSNLFVGSGLMPLKKYLDAGIPVALGSDVAGGTNFSLLQELNQAYKIQALQMFALDKSSQSVKLSGVRLLYLATLAGAEALSLQNEIGNFKTGNCADIVVIDPALDSYIAARLANTSGIVEKLFVLSTLGSKHIISDVFIDGQVQSPSLIKTGRNTL